MESGDKIKNCYGDMVLAEYIGGELSAKENKHIKSHLQECDKCFSSLSFYYKSSKEMKTAIEREKLFQEKTVKENKKNEEKTGSFEPGKSLLEKINAFFSNLLPVSSPVPTFAITLVFVVGILFLLNKGPGQPGIKIIRITDTEYLSYSEDNNDRLGQFSFLEGKQNKENKYSGVEIILSDYVIRFKWNALPNTTSYTFMLSDISKEKKIIFSKTDKHAEFSVSNDLLKKGKRYRWQLKGQLDKGESFSAEGEFVMG